MNILKQAFVRQPRMPRFLCHLFQRLSQGRLNLITGAGISIDAAVPSWHGLLDRLAERSGQLKTDLDKHRESGLNPEYLGQIIYHRHRKEFSDGVAADMREATINHDWAEAIHDAIYKEVPDNIDTVIGGHPYLAAVRDFARKVPLVINFNFDDILSDAIGHQIDSSKEDRGKSFTVVWQPPLVERTNTTTIYHVNGILPRISLKKRSPQLIFTEDAFADALARSPGISGEYLFLRFVQNTMLIIGHSLSDSSLKNYLRRNRDKSPANHHYMVFWLPKSDAMTMEQLNDIFDANLELYNLVTIFLTSEEINQFFTLLNRDERDFRDILDTVHPDNRSRFHYYIVGPVASGKSTLLEHLRCFNTFEEWTRPTPKEMYMSTDHFDLEQDRQKTVDEFLYKELKEKNYRMVQAGIGVHFMDRAPLDLYAFSTDKEECKRKTRDLENQVTRDRTLQPGEIVFITATGDTLVQRNLGRGRLPKVSGGADYLTSQSDTLKKIYTPVMVVETDGHDPGEIARRVARHALLGEYRPLNLGEIMDRYR